MQKQTAATRLGCMDGRLLESVNSWIRDFLDVDYIDTITEPGMDKVLSNSTSYIEFLLFKLGLILNILKNFFNLKKTFDSKYIKKLIDINFLKFKVFISIKKHSSKALFITGHEDCAGNPVSEEHHHKEIITSCKKVIMEWDLNIPVYGLYIKKRDKEGKKWEIKIVFNSLND